MIISASQITPAFAVCYKSLNGARHAILWGQDDDAKKMKFEQPISATVASLHKKYVEDGELPDYPGDTRHKEEWKVYRVEAFLVDDWWHEDFGASRLILKDDPEDTTSITAMLPHPSCAEAGAWEEEITKAANTLYDEFLPAGYSGVPVIIVAPVYFVYADFWEGFYLGPVLSIEFVGDETDEGDDEDDGSEEETPPPPPPPPAPNLEIAIPPVARDIVLSSGQSSSFTISTISRNGFDSDVRVAVVSIPNDLNIAVSPSSIPAPGAGEVSVTLEARTDTFPMAHLVDIDVWTPEGQSWQRRIQIDVVCDPPQILSQADHQPRSASVTSGDRVTLRVNPTSGTEPYRYQWYLGARGSTASPVDGASSSEFLTPPVEKEVTYWVRVTNGCGSVDSWAATLKPTGSQEGTKPSGRRRTVIRPN